MWSRESPKRVFRAIWPLALIMVGITLIGPDGVDWPMVGGGLAVSLLGVVAREQVSAMLDTADSGEWIRNHRTRVVVALACPLGGLVLAAFGASS